MPVSRCRRPAGPGAEAWTQQVGVAASSDAAGHEQLHHDFVVRAGRRGTACWRRYSPMAVVDGAPPGVLRRDVQLQQPGGPGQPVQVRLELAGLPAHGQQRLENTVAAGGALVRRHQLRLGRIGQPAASNAGSRKTSTVAGAGSSGRRSHGFSLVRRAAG